MKTLDWIVIAVPLLVVLAIGIYTQRYMKSVADFMSGGRLAGRYLLAVAKGELQAGAVVFVMMFEVMSQAGFTLTWWTWLEVPVLFIIAISGFVVYRYRETRCMTLAQFFEVRYSKNFRISTGVLAYIAGIFNFGIIPAVGARFFVHFLHLPHQMQIFSFSVPTYVLLMGLFLTVTLVVTLAGGLLTVMITDCVEGMFSQIFYLFIIGALVMLFSWNEISEVLSNRPPGQSLLNPFDSHKIDDFNIWYVAMALFGSVYGTMAWQNASAYNSAALTPHESRMGSVLGRWREFGKVAVVTLLAICAVTFLEHPDFATQAAAAHVDIASISQPQIQKQMTVPVALSYLLPIGIKGVLCAVLLMGIIGGDSTHMHSWGGIFVQDVLVPLRKKPFGPKQHIFLLRLSIIMVAVFAFLFGTFFTQTEYITMWFKVTTAVFVGGAGSAIIGGLYWKKGTTWGAWAALLTGSGLSVGGIFARQIYGSDFPLNGIQISFSATLIAIAMYVTVSLLTNRKDFNMDRMLHRGEYAEILPPVEKAEELLPPKKLPWLYRAIGIDSNFTTSDKWIAGGLFAWSAFWFFVILIGSIWNLIAPWPTHVWATYWHIAGIGVPIFMAIVASIWFTWGGLRDIASLFRRLRVEKTNDLDDGTVVNNQNLSDVHAMKEKI